MKKRLLTTQNMTRIAILAALAAIIFAFVPSIPVVAFYKLDFSNLPALLGGFAMGPLAGAFIVLIKDLAGMINSSTGFVGELADFLMSVAMVVPAAAIYRAHKNRKGALIGMLTGTACMIVAGCLANYFILIPFYVTAFHMPMEKVVAMATKVLPFVDTEMKLILFVTAPFNLLKGVVLSVITYIIYKPLSPLLHGKRK